MKVTLADPTRRSNPALLVSGGLLAVIVLISLSLYLAYVSSHHQSLQDWGAFFLTGLISAAIVLAAWWLLRFSERSMHAPLPRWLGALVLLAFALRLGAGVLWYTMLPVYGHNSPTEQAGYVMADAEQRDQAAWDLAQSEKSLWSAFRNNRATDQYGGLLFLSAWFYRNLGGQSHHPLQIAMISAAFSSLAILFTFAFSRRVWDPQVAWLAAGVLTIYPDAVLMGSSQMREAYLIPLTVAAFYGLAHYSDERSWPGLTWILGALLLCLPFSPPFAALLVGLLLLAAIWIAFTGEAKGSRPFQGIATRFAHTSHRRLWAILVIMFILALVGAWFAVAQFTPEKATTPIAAVNWWINKSAEWQAHLTERASGKIQVIFDRTPSWMHAPLLLGYGVVQPFLPAALVVTSQAPIWQGIAIWRALGWALLLPMLVYAPLRARKFDRSGWAGALSLVVWLVILVASFRGGGDQWDNPRYRGILAGLQVALAAWAWLAQRRAADPLFRRALVGVLLILAWFVPWYLSREFHLPWPVGDLYKLLGLGFASAALYILWDWARQKAL